MVNTYATYDDFETFGITPEMASDDAGAYLRTASIHVNNVCFGRIERNWDDLPERTREMVREATLIQANFYKHNKELFEQNLKQYSIAGVSMTLEVPRGAEEIDGIIADSRAVALLDACGLRSLNVGWMRGLM